MRNRMRRLRGRFVLGLNGHVGAVLAMMVIWLSCASGSIALASIVSSTKADFSVREDGSESPSDISDQRTVEERTAYGMQWSEESTEDDPGEGRRTTHPSLDSRDPSYFDHLSSTSFERFPEVPFLLRYLDGTALSGDVCKDILQVGLFRASAFFGGIINISLPHLPSALPNLPPSFDSDSMLSGNHEFDDDRAWDWFPTVKSADHVDTHPHSTASGPSPSGWSSYLGFGRPQRQFLADGILGFGPPTQSAVLHRSTDPPNLQDPSHPGHLLPPPFGRGVPGSVSLDPAEVLFSLPSFLLEIPVAKEGNLGNNIQGLKRSNLTKSSVPQSKLQPTSSSRHLRGRVFAVFSYRDQGRLLLGGYDSSIISTPSFQKLIKECPSTAIGPSDPLCRFTTYAVPLTRIRFADAELLSTASGVYPAIVDFGTSCIVLPDGTRGSYGLLRSPYRVFLQTIERYGIERILRESPPMLITIGDVTISIPFRELLLPEPLQHQTGSSTANPHGEGQLPRMCVSSVLHAPDLLILGEPFFRAAMVIHDLQNLDEPLLGVAQIRLRNMMDHPLSKDVPLNMDLNEGTDAKLFSVPLSRWQENRRMKTSPSAANANNTHFNTRNTLSSESNSSLSWMSLIVPPLKHPRVRASPLSSKFSAGSKVGPAIQFGGAGFREVLPSNARVFAADLLLHQSRSQLADAFSSKSTAFINFVSGETRAPINFLDWNDSSVSVPLRSLSGVLYTVEVLAGDPPQKVSLVLDTGSSAVAVFLAPVGPSWAFVIIASLVGFAVFAVMSYLVYEKCSCCRGDGDIRFGIGGRNGHRSRSSGPSRRLPSLTVVADQVCENSAVLGRPYDTEEKALSNHRSNQFETFSDARSIPSDDGLELEPNHPLLTEPHIFRSNSLPPVQDSVKLSSDIEDFSRGDLSGSVVSAPALEDSLSVEDDANEDIFGTFLYSNEKMTFSPLLGHANKMNSSASRSNPSSSRRFRLLQKDDSMLGNGAMSSDRKCLSPVPGPEAHHHSIGHSVSHDLSVQSVAPSDTTYSRQSSTCLHSMVSALDVSEPGEFASAIRFRKFPLSQSLPSSTSSLPKSSSLACHSLSGTASSVSSVPSSTVIPSGPDLYQDSQATTSLRDPLSVPSNHLAGTVRSETGSKASKKTSALGRLDLDSSCFDGCDDF